jgi:hypothetical protein
MDSFLSTTQASKAIGESSKTTNQSLSDSGNFIESDDNSKSNSSKSIIDPEYNSPDFKLGLDKESSIYIFRNGLYSRTLLPIDTTKARRMTIECTL